MDRTIVNLYYLGTKLIVVLSFLLALFLKDAYGLEGYQRYILAVFIALYLAINLFSKKGDYFRLRFMRFLDYTFALLAVLLSKNLYGVIPAGFIFGLYSVIYIRELLLLFLIATALLLINGSLLHRIEAEDLLLSLIYLLGILGVSTKVNILSILKERKATLQRLKEKIRMLDTANARLARNLQDFHEILEVLNFLSDKRYLENLPQLLEGLLKAEKVLLKKKNSPTYILPKEGFINIAVGDILLMVKPKEKYLLKDKRYREKLFLLTKVLRPYIESFLANRR